MVFGTAAALLHRLESAERPVVFLVGSPLTAPDKAGAPGVPGVGAMIELARAQFASGSRAREAFDVAIEHAQNPYQAAFAFVLEWCGPDVQNRVIREAVLKARLPDPAGSDAGTGAVELENDLDGWHFPPGVAALGALAASLPERFGRLVLTTNFDPLIGLAIRRAGGHTHTLRLHGDMNLESVTADGCAVVHLHGYWHGSDTLHNPQQLGQPRPQLEASLARLLREATVVVLAYGGWDDIFTRTLVAIARDQGAFPDVLWGLYGNDESKLAEQNASLFASLRPALDRGRAFFYRGVDVNTLLPELAGALGARGGGVSASTRGRPGAEREERIPRAEEEDEILSAIRRRRQVQLLGPPGMGKSSLLRWAQQQAGTQGLRTAFVNARGLEGSSPARLVLAVAGALGQYDEVHAELRAARVEATADDAAQALAAMATRVPSGLALFVDDADALPQAEHGFTSAFFEVLRDLGKAGRLVWVSASRVSLVELFSHDGVASPFLSDALLLRVKPLSRAASEAYLAPRIDASRLELAISLAGGFPSAVRWLAERLSSGAAVDPAALRAAYLAWMRPLHERALRDLDAPGLALLRRCARAAAPRAALSAAEQGAAAALCDEGWLREEGDAFVVTSPALGEVALRG